MNANIEKMAQDRIDEFIANKPVHRGIESEYRREMTYYNAVLGAWYAWLAAQEHQEKEGE
jgi:hypothetical protein